MDFRLTPDQRRFRDEVRAWLKANLPPGWGTPEFPEPETPDEKAAFSRAWLRKLHEGGWSGLDWPVEFGGRGLGVIEQLLFEEEYARAGAPDIMNMRVGLNLVGPTLIAAGTPWQREHFLPRILDGTHLWCQGFSEPNAGSDLASLRTRAERDGDHFLLSGQKIWTSFAAQADWCFLIARTRADGPKHHGLTVFLVDMRLPGIEVRPLVEMTGHAWFNEVFLDRVRVPARFVVGEVDRGWQVVLHMLGHERAGATPHVRLEQDALRLARLSRRLERAVSQAALLPEFRQRIARCYIDARVLRFTSYRNVTAFARTGRPGPEGSILKLFWSELEQRIFETAAAMLGPQILPVRGDPRAPDRGQWAHSLLWSRAATIYAGTSEIQRNIIATRVLGLPRGG